jgi:hypothetical protein
LWIFVQTGGAKKGVKRGKAEGSGWRKREFDGGQGFSFYIEGWEDKGRY